MVKIRPASLAIENVEGCHTLLDLLFEAGGTLPASELRRQNRSIRDQEWNRDNLLNALVLVGAVEQMGTKKTASFVLTKYGLALLNSYKDYS